MTRKSQHEVDSIERDIELALKPGAFVSDRACSSFVIYLEKVAAQIGTLANSDPARAVTLYETFLAACYVKIEELDDSSACFGQFVEELYCGWIKARQASEASPEKTASRLLCWMDQDDYGFCCRLERNAVKVFDKANLAAFVKQVLARFDAAGKKSTPRGDRLHDYTRHHWGEVLRTLYAAQKDVAAYVDLANEMGITVQDCHTVAKLLVSKRKPNEALSWVERGIEKDKRAPHSSMAGYDLAKLKRDLLKKLGRDNEALDAAWSDYIIHPSRHSYDELMKYVPRAERATWHEKAIEAAQGGDLPSVMELFVKTKELGRLANLVRHATDDELEDLSHYTSEPVAKRLEEAAPDLAAQLWRAQGLRIVNAKKSKYYNAALSNFERAKRCFEQAGMEAEWDRTVDQVRADHHRKSGFMPGFERLVAGMGPSDEPSFLDRAKARWSARERKIR